MPVIFRYEKELIDLEAAGKSWDEICLALKCNRETVRKYLRKNGIQTHAKRITELLDLNRLSILDRYKNGESGNQIADSLKVSRQTLYNYLHKLKINVIDKKKTELNNLMEREKEKILSLYFDEKLTMEEIGSIYETWGNNISEYFKRWKILPRAGYIRKSSSLERRFRQEFLKNLPDKNIRPQFKIAGRFYDFYIPEANLLIEVNGDYWHGNPKVFKKLNKYQKASKRRDSLKKDIAHDNNFKILFVWEYDMIHNHSRVVNALQKYGIK